MLIAIDTVALLFSAASVNGVFLSTLVDRFIHTSCRVSVTFDLHSSIPLAIANNTMSIAFPMSSSSLSYGAFMHMHMHLYNTVLVIPIQFSLRVETHASVSLVHFVILTSLQDLRQRDRVLKMYFNAVTRQWGSYYCHYIFKSLVYIYRAPITVTGWHLRE